LLVGDWERVKLKVHMDVVEILQRWPVLRQLRARDLLGRGLTARTDPAPAPSREPVGFFTDSSVCIGCKACEVACRDWNGLPSEPGERATRSPRAGEGGGGDGWGPAFSYDHTGGLGADSWRHVAFVEQESAGGLRWLMNSDVCKHCAEAACLDVCPTGALFRTEFGTVVLQEDVCNGCGYCVPACPFGVIERRETDGRAFKCTMCYDRLQHDLQPACAKACPTGSITFGPRVEMESLARARQQRLWDEDVAEARLYGLADDSGEGVGGAASIFLLLDRPEVYGLPSTPEAPARHLEEGWTAAAVGAAALTVGVIAAVLGARR
jgi:formate dehydrogenase iron-sulfur subunit